MYFHESPQSFVDWGHHDPLYLCEDATQVSKAGLFVRHILTPAMLQMKKKLSLRKDQGLKDSQSCDSKHGWVLALSRSPGCPGFLHH